MEEKKKEKFPRSVKALVISLFGAAAQIGKSSKMIFPSAFGIGSLISMKHL